MSDPASPIETTDPNPAGSIDRNGDLWFNVVRGWSEDVWAILIGGGLLAVAGGLTAIDPDLWVGRVAKPGAWSAVITEGLTGRGGGIAAAGLLIFLTTLVAVVATGAERAGKYALGFGGVFLLATIAYVMAGQTIVKSYNLEYALWALAVGLVIANTVGTPGWLRAGARAELFIKSGLVLLGAEVLLSRLIALGVPGICVAWIVTPIVLISTYAFGQRVLKMKSRSLNMVISADMSVCGVSAAIAAAAACRAKREELSLAIGLSLTFTVLMMVVMPPLVIATGMDPRVGAAWMGGTIDSTGAVAVAGATLGDEGLKIAATVKMIQNILIGVSAFGIATYWVTSVERSIPKAAADAPAPGGRARLSEVWRRFPKFVLGFVAASVVFSILHQTDGGPEFTEAVIKGGSKTLRGWFFCLAFVAIGLETDFRALAGPLRGGKPLMLYVAGQTLNLTLTLLMAWLMFGVLFSDWVSP